MEALKSLFEKYNINLISWAFFFLGGAVILDILIIKNEFLKVGIIILFLLGCLYIISRVWNFIVNKISNHNENKKKEEELIESLKHLKKKEMGFIYKSFKEGKNRFNYYEITHLIEGKFFDLVKDFDDEVIVKLNPIIKKYLDKTDK